MEKLREPGKLAQRNTQYAIRNTQCVSKNNEQTTDKDYARY